MSRMKTHVLASSLLICVIVFLYKVADVLHKVSSWDVLWNPPTVGDICVALAFALAAMALALGLNVRSFLEGVGLGALLPAQPPPPTDPKP